MESELLEVKKQASAAVDLGRWLGRREAFSMVAGRCSAAEAESLRRIRDDKLYLGCSRTWDEFCERELGASRRNINRVISYLEEFGPQYFQVVQLTRISPQQYRAIASHIDEGAVNLNGEVVALLPENQQKISEAVKALIDRSHPAARKHEPDFTDARKRCESAADILESSGYSPTLDEQVALGAALKRLWLASRRFGVFLNT
jgi:hypothetical protein